MGASAKTILFFNHTAALGGAEIALFNLVTALNPEQYHPVVVLGNSGPLYTRLRQASIETHVLPLPSSIVDARKDTLCHKSLLRLQALGQALLYAKSLARFMSARRAQIIHTNSLKAHLIGGVAARICRVPVIWHIHTRIASDYLPRFAVRGFRRLCRILPNYIVANSLATLKTLHLASHENAEVIYNGVPDASIVDELKSPCSFDSDERSCCEVAKPLVVGMVGRITPWKGQHVFIQAANLVRTKFAHISFQIIGAPLFGEEAYERHLRNLATSLDMDGCLQFVGFSSDVPHLLHDLDVLVHASIIGEPFGLVIVEGMMAHKPVIATAGGGVPEIVKDNVTGLLIPMNDVPAMAAAMCLLLRDPEKRLVMGQLGYKRAQELFPTEVYAQKFQAVYQRLS